MFATVEEAMRSADESFAGAYKMGFDFGIKRGIYLMRSVGYLSDAASEKLESLLLKMCFSQRNMNVFAHLSSIDLKKVEDAERYINVKNFFARFGDLGKFIAASQVLSAVSAIIGAKETKIFDDAFYDEFIKKVDLEVESVSDMMALGNEMAKKGKGYGDVFWPGRLRAKRCNSFDQPDTEIEQIFQFSDSFIVNSCLEQNFFEIEIRSTLEETTDKDVPQIEKILLLSARKVINSFPESQDDREDRCDELEKSPQSLPLIRLIEHLCLEYGACFDVIAQPTSTYLENHDPELGVKMKELAKALYSHKRNR